jgi:hypothetical protein|tara:strand:+ start:267 stop:950 length:684 start_codon:yes stop_codon:yes gene_type:complete
MIEWISENYKWVFSGIGLAVVSGLFGGLLHLLKTRRQKLQRPLETAIEDHLEQPESLVTISGNSTINGVVAGRDVVINNPSGGISTDELIPILQLRASQIQDQLSEHYHYAPAKKYLSKFGELHLQHISALENDNLVLAHEVLKSIYDLSGELEKDEFWERHDAETPDLLYSLSPGMFQKGRLICRYLVGEMSSNSELYPREISLQSPQNLKIINELYKKILKTHQR